MDKLDLGATFLNAVKAIYHDQTATIRINNDVTASFKVTKGMLSPLLFIMVSEFLLIKVREDETILSLKCRGFE